jgi:hypothetical protein
MVCDVRLYRWSQGDLNPRPLACHLSAQSSGLFMAVQNMPLSWTDAGVVVQCRSYPFESVAAPVAAIVAGMWLVLFPFCQIRGCSQAQMGPRWRPLSSCGGRKRSATRSSACIDPQPATSYVHRLRRAPWTGRAFGAVACQRQARRRILRSDRIRIRTDGQARLGEPLQGWSTGPDAAPSPASSTSGP